MRAGDGGGEGVDGLEIQTYSVTSTADTREFTRALSGLRVGPSDEIRRQMRDPTRTLTPPQNRLIPARSLPAIPKPNPVTTAVACERQSGNQQPACPHHSSAVVGERSPNFRIRSKMVSRNGSRNGVRPYLEISK